MGQRNVRERQPKERPSAQQGRPTPLRGRQAAVASIVDTWVAA